MKYLRFSAGFRYSIANTWVPELCCLFVFFIDNRPVFMYISMYVCTPIKVLYFIDFFFVVFCCCLLCILCMSSYNVHTWYITWHTLCIYIHMYIHEKKCKCMRNIFICNAALCIRQQHIETVICLLAHKQTTTRSFMQLKLCAWQWSPNKASASTLSYQKL